MNADQYIKSELEKLKTPLGLVPAVDLEDQIVKLALSKKFRKYSANDDLINHVKEVVHYCVSRNQPINFTFLHGAYKLWRLDEAPEADFAELFALIYYTKYVKPICEIYQPGVWFDFFVDDYIVEVIDNLAPEEVQQYLKSYQKIMDFLKPYQPNNLKMTITTVGSRFESRAAFDASVEKNLAKVPLADLDDEDSRVIGLNVRPREGQTDDPLWKEKVCQIHDAYMITKGEPGYHKNCPDKILVFSQPLPSGTTISLGTTKSSIAKFWVGVGALQPSDDAYKMIILSPSQLESAKFTWQPVDLGLDGKNFKQVRVLEK